MYLHVCSNVCTPYYHEHCSGCSNCFLFSLLYWVTTLLRYEIARAFPSSLHLRARYIKDRVPTPSIIQKVVCSTRHTRFDYAECCERQGTTTVIQDCPKHKRQCKTPLLRCVVTCKGTTKYYPIRVYPYCSLISTLRCMLLRPGFLDLCEEWCSSFDNSVMDDIFAGKIWKDFQVFEGTPFLATKYNLAFMINIDWFSALKTQNILYGCHVFINYEYASQGPFQERKHYTSWTHSWPLRASIDN